MELAGLSAVITTMTASALVRRINSLPRCKRMLIIEKVMRSRRINQERRLVYSVEDNIVTVTVVAAKGHYES
jgi:propanediol dehydratase large subunit